MTQPIRISVTMDGATFKSFVSFDLFHHRKAWRRPAVFMAILLVAAVICLTQMGSVPDAWKLSLVLAVIALGLPLVYFGTFAHNLKNSIKKMGLTEPKPFYSLQLDDSGFSSGWPVSKTRPSLPASATGSTSTWPTARRTPCTSTSSSRRLTYGTPAWTPRGIC